MRQNTTPALFHVVRVIAAAVVPQAAPISSNFAKIKLARFGLKRRGRATDCSHIARWVVNSMLTSARLEFSKEDE